MGTHARRSVLVAIAFATLGAPAAATARTHTIETIFHPFKSDGTPTIHVHSKSGYCYSGSLAINRDDAWRCFTGNFLYDPCFSSPLVPGKVLCPGVNVTSGVEIKLTRGLPKRYADSGKPSLKQQPWDIQLTDGRHFQYSSGASNFVDGKRLNYFCGATCPVGLWGFPRRHTQPWTIVIARVTAKSLRTRRAIRHVWM
jgi:hypothetical protein